MESKKEIGWGVDVTKKSHHHYYKDGISLCKRKVKPFHVDNLKPDVDYTFVLGYQCSFCLKALKKISNE